MNDSYGHRMGDALLVAVSSALQVGDAVVGRYGGDEFVAILARTDHEGAERYRAAVNERLAGTQIADEERGIELDVSASTGFAMHPDDEPAIPKLIELADERMYAAKRQRPVVRPRLVA